MTIQIMLSVTNIFQLVIIQYISIITTNSCTFFVHVNSILVASNNHKYFQMFYYDHDDDAAVIIKDKCECSVQLKSRTASF